MVALRAGVFADRNFAIYSIGNTISWLGMWAQRIGVGWLSWDLTHSSFWVGLVSLGQFLPLIICAPAFGVLLDQSSRRRYAITVNVVLTILATALYALTAARALTIEVLCGFSVLLGIGNSAYQPVRLALINDVAPQGRLSDAIAANSIVFNATRTIGPALAGLAISSLGVASTFAINAVSYGAIIAALWIVDLKSGPPRAPATGFVKESLDGLRYVTGHAGIRELMALSAVTSLLGRGTLELLPAFADGLFHRGSAGFATLTTATGIGAIVGALALSRAGSGLHLPRLARSGALGLGLLLAVFGAMSSYLGAVFVIATVGLAVTLCSVGLQVLLQSSIDDAYRGRVLGLWGMVNIGSPGVGGALIGVMAQVTGLRIAAVTSGLACAALVWLTIRNGGYRSHTSG